MEKTKKEKILNYLVGGMIIVFAGSLIGGVLFVLYRSFNF